MSDREGDESGNHQDGTSKKQEQPAAGAGEEQQAVEDQKANGDNTKQPAEDQRRLDGPKPQTNDHRHRSDEQRPRRDDYSSSYPRQRAPNQSSDAKELAKYQVLIQSKRFYIDVKENDRGRFFKLAEISSSGNKKRIVMPMSMASEFRDILTDMSEYYLQLGPPADELGDQEDRKLKSERLFKDWRRYYFDLKENKRGRFLRVRQIDGDRKTSQIAIPAQGLVDYRDRITEVIDEHGVDDAEDDSQGDLPEAQTFRVDNKAFYFDVGSNYRGVYIRVSEVQHQRRVRNAITIPESSWPKFRDMFAAFIDKRSAPQASGDHSRSPDTGAVDGVPAGDE